MRKLEAVENDTVVTARKEVERVDRELVKWRKKLAEVQGELGVAKKGEKELADRRAPLVVKAKAERDEKASCNGEDHGVRVDRVEHADSDGRGERREKVGAHRACRTRAEAEEQRRCGERKRGGQQGPEDGSGDQGERGVAPLPVSLVDHRDV